MAWNSDSVRKVRQSFDFLFINNKSAPIRQEDELTIHLSKTELFDRVILLPHAELNAAVYHAVNQFTAKYTGNRLKLTIFCDPVSESLQNTFREVYAAHYRDEYRKVILYMRRRFMRVVMLIIAGLIAYFAVKYLSANTGESNFLIAAIANIGAFCLWEIGYTQFSWKDAEVERKRIVRAMEAEIEFQCGLKKEDKTKA